MPAGTPSITYPTEGLTNVAGNLITWTTSPVAQAYIVLVGTTRFGMDVANSGILPATRSSFTVPALPSGPTLHTTLLININGVWTYQTTIFATNPRAVLAYPADGQTSLDPARPFTWSSPPGNQGYILVVGTSPNGSNLVNSGILPPSQLSYRMPPLPSGVRLFATLLTRINGAWSPFQTITFTAGPRSLTRPVNGQLNLATPTKVTWTPMAGAQNYYLVIGTTLYRTANSGILAAGQLSFNVAKLPSGKLLIATLFTKINGFWTYEVVGFTAA